MTERSQDYIQVTGHVSAKVKYQIDTQMSNEINDVSSDIFSETYDVFNSSSHQGIFVNDGKKYYETPQLSSFSINFAMYDSHDNELTTGGEYILGKFDKQDRFYLYSGTNNGRPKWTKQDLDYNKKQIISQDHNMILKGNNNYFIDGQEQAFELDHSVWDFDELAQKKVFESLFTINGLSSDYQYVLYQAKVPDNYKMDTQAINFKVGEDSKRKAQFSNYKINGDILDMKYDVNEYNAIAINPKNKKVNRVSNPYVMTLFGISIVILMASIVLAILLKLK